MPQTKYHWFAACLLIWLFACLPLLTHSGLPAGADVSIHYWRTFDLENNWQQGDVLARWSELYYYGYGAPSFQYTANGFYVLAALVGKLPLIDDVLRIKIVWAFAIMIGTVGMYRFTERRFGAAGALLATAAYVFSPAFLMIEPIVRGSFGVTMGMGCVALALFALDDYTQNRRYGWIIVLSMVGLLLSHNLTALTFVPILAAWLLWQTLTNRQAYPVIWQTWGLFILSGALTSYFWLPVLLERDLVDVARALGNEHLNFRNHFIPLADLLRPAARFDVNLLNNRSPQTLGVLQWVLSIAGLVSAGFMLRRLTPLMRELIFWAGVAAISIFLITPQSQFLWERSSTLQLFLFPLRFMNAAAFALAFIIGGLAITRWRPGLLAILTVALIVQGLIGSVWNWRDDFPTQATAQQYVQHELDTGILGGTSANEFLPRTVITLPPPTGFVIDSLAGDQPVQRINPYTLPAGITVKPLASSPMFYSFEIETPAAYTVEVLQLYFPLWTATLDSEPLPLRPSDPYGFTLVDVPAGTHRIELRYTPSAIQYLSSGLSLIALIGVIFWLYRWRPAGSTTPPESIDWRLFAGIGIGVTLALIVLMREGVAWTASPPGEARAASQVYNATFDDDLYLLGYDLEPGANLWKVHFYWQSPTPPDQPINTFVHLLDANGQIVGQHDKLDFTVDAPGQYWRDEYMIAVNQPPVSLRLGLWRCEDEVNSFDCARRETLTTQESTPQEFIILPLTP